ncbi:MAG: hypothetical protein EOP50_00390 [Sphingobacteriales bacterium]|nr:MAG: hypothetical protein EOP50_00390 [Sphingobacteriales bacterium]
MTPTACLVDLIKRIAACGGGDAYFTQDEITCWPPDAVKAMAAVGLLAQAKHAGTTECDGCEEACTMPVHIIPERPPMPGRAFIVCDRRDDIGRVRVDIERLARRKSSGLLLAQALGKGLFQEASPVDLGGNRWKLGNFQGLKHKSPLELSLAFPPVLAIAGHTVELCELLSVKRAAVVIDQPALRKLVDNPTGYSVEESEKPEEKAKRYRQRMKELKSEGVSAFQKTLATEEGLHVSRIKQILAAHPEKPKRADWTGPVKGAKAGPPSKKAKPQR